MKMFLTAVNAGVDHDPEAVNQLFHEMLGKLIRSGKIKQNEMARTHFDRVFAGARFLTERFTKWSSRIESEEVDVTNPALSPYNLVVARFGVRMTNLPPLDLVACRKYAFSISSSGDDSEGGLLNGFWHEFIRLRKDADALRLF